jgi:hypothetical protein
MNPGKVIEFNINGSSFIPERWETPTKEMRDASLPFGGGSRSKPTKEISFTD